jgi:putative lipoic acid-binding regulatory protein
LIDLNKEKLKLDYPCSWVYKIVTLESSNINNIVKSVLKERNNIIKESKVSRKGKFKSYSIDLQVFSDEDRKELYTQFGAHNDIKMVL